jgi:tryptophan synthase alpha chain
VRNGDQAAEIAGFADGVIVGSAFVTAAEQGGPQAVRALAQELAAGVARAGLATQPA